MPCGKISRNRVARRDGQVRRNARQREPFELRRLARLAVSNFAFHNATKMIGRMEDERSDADAGRGIRF
jgi:hypothetical protein